MHDRAADHANYWLKAARPPPISQGMTQQARATVVPSLSTLSIRITPRVERARRRDLWIMTGLASSFLVTTLSIFIVNLVA
jgi:hypothetical protein